MNLADIAALPGGQRLPSSGLLSFFFDSAQEAYGFEPESRGGCRVVYTPVSARLERAAFPDALGRFSKATLLRARFEVRRLRAEPIVTYPPASADVDLAIPQLDWDSAQRNHDLGMAYAEVYDAFAPIAKGLHNRLLGHPMLEQGDLQREAHLAFHGVPPFDPAAPPDPRREQLEPGARCWRLLLQIDSVEDAGMMWGHDAGCIYFMIRDEDLAAHRFDRCWPILQCG